MLGGIIGATVGILLVEVVFANNQSWPDVVPVALAVAGWLTGTALVRRGRGQHGASPVGR